MDGKRVEKRNADEIGLYIYVMIGIGIVGCVGTSERQNS